MSGAVDSGVFVAAAVVLVVSVSQGWPVIGWLAAAVLIGVMVTNAARRQRDPEYGKVSDDRPWRRRQ